MWMENVLEQNQTNLAKQLLYKDDSDYGTCICGPVQSMISLTTIL